MKIGSVLVALVVLLAVAARPAAAQVVTYEARGRADDTAADPRTQALDVAFAGAVTEAVADLAGAGARAKAAEVDREIIKRARRFVASFQVKSQSADRGSLELEVAVRIDVDKVRARLVELGVPLKPRDPGTVPVTSHGATGKTATILLRVVGAGPLAATFGAAASPDVPGVARISEALTAAGYTVVPASAAGPPPGPENELPVDDTGARALGADAKATIAVIAGVNVGEAGPVRGLPLRAIPASARLRVVDIASGKVLEDVTLASGAWGTDERLPRVAAEAAAAAVASSAWQPRGTTVIGSGATITAGRGITVRVRGDKAWSAASSIRAQLGTAPGVERVTWAGVGGDQVALAVAGPTAAKIAGQIKTSGVLARVDVDDDVVDVVLQ
ncbi:MAG TPA: hypothetical protein VM261_23190 [Kofleriaceae bacterium]|nr:hypothetical protein [Kofleriaceae bacterium]